MITFKEFLLEVKLTPIHSDDGCFHTYIDQKHYKSENQVPGHRVHELHAQINGSRSHGKLLNSIKKEMTLSEVK